MKRRFSPFVSILIIAALASCSNNPVNVPVTDKEGDGPFVGKWIETERYYSLTKVWDFRADGTAVLYNDYAETVPDEEFEWEYADGEMTLTYYVEGRPDREGFGWTVNSYTEDRAELSYGEGIEFTLYRKGSSQTSNVFDGEIQTLSLEDPHEITLEYGESAFYAFNVTAGSRYLVSWDDAFSGSSTFDGDVSVSAIRASQDSFYFIGIDSGYENSGQIIQAMDTTIYIIINAKYTGGTVSFMVQYDS